jgi:hypothetical protein
MTPYTHAEAGPRPEVLVLCSVVPVRDVGGSYAEPRGACALATPRRLNAAIGRPAAARRRRSLPMPFEPMPSRRSDWSVAHRLHLCPATKAPLRPTHAPCPHTEPPLQPPVVPTTSSTLRPLTPPTRVAPACPRTPSSLPGHLLLRPNPQLASVRTSAAAAGSPSPSLYLRLLSKPMGPRSISSRSH